MLGVVAVSSGIAKDALEYTCASLLLKDASKGTSPSLLYPSSSISVNLGLLNIPVAASIVYPASVKICSNIIVAFIAGKKSVSRKGVNACCGENSVSLAKTLVSTGA